MNKQEKLAKFNKFIDWLELPPTARYPKTEQEYQKFHHVSSLSLSRWKAKWIEMKKLPPPKDELLEFKEMMRQQAISGRGSAVDRQNYGRMLGAFVDRTEETIVTLNANDYSNISKEVLRQLRDNFKELGGVCPVCGFTRTISPEICAHPEPERSQEGQVGALAISDRPPDPLQTVPGNNNPQS